MKRAVLVGSALLAFAVSSRARAEQIPVETSPDWAFRHSPAPDEYLKGASERLKARHLWLRSPSLEKTYQKYLSFEAFERADRKAAREKEVRASPKFQAEVLREIEYDMLRYYGSDFYKALNAAMRDHRGAEYVDEIQVLNSALSRLHGKHDREKQLVHRYYTLRETEEEFMKRYPEGAIVREAAFTSTTASVYSSDGLWVTGDVLFKIEQRSGSYISMITGYQDYKCEAEVLIPPETPLRVVKVNKLRGERLKFIVHLVEE